MHPEEHVYEYFNLCGPNTTSVELLSCLVGSEAFIGTQQYNKTKLYNTFEPCLEDVYYHAQSYLWGYISLK